MKNLFFGKNASKRLKTAKFLKHDFPRAHRKRKSPIDEKGLFRRFKAFSESQFHAGEELYTRDGIVVI